MEVEEAYTEAVNSIAERHTRFNNGASMNKIIVYRQIETDDDMFLIYDKTNGELDYAKKAAKNLNAKLVYVVAVKRRSSRFFGASMGNPRPGTVIDQDVTLPNRFDFYIVSHAGRKGSVMPTYYFIVHDDLELPPNVLQQFTFQMCHMYYNWSGTIKVPAVCQYAFKQAVMCGEVTKMAAGKKLR
ncbi:hypothetical protein RvY_15486 [Ramazzottius varieornatus]|uniref:Piwi domain-containing protein n=1 Tax=Ramazzottius varieornatus TaxID=947166 RepID=A0A1D1VV37_RAMVA|nr:hypothetical protein RvY_15486 [Ramazzottius varieornatus]